MFGGYLWFSGAYRVPVTGGTPELVPGITNFYAVSTGTALLATQQREPQGSYWSLGTLDRTATYQTLIGSIWEPYRPLQLVYDRGELFWQGTTTVLLRALLTDSAFHADPAFDGGFGTFAVTSDAILFDFTSNGYRSIPR